MLQWMVWTVPTAIFFLGIAFLLAVMTVWQLLVPTIERRGFLPIVTTRGDRFFIGLLCAAYIHLGFVGFTDFSIWLALVVSLFWMMVVMRWG